MSRFIREVKYFLAQLKEGYPRQRRKEAHWQQIAPLLGIEIEPCSLGECFEAATKFQPMYLENIGHIAHILWNRSSRGKMTLQEVVERFGK